MTHYQLLITDCLLRPQNEKGLRIIVSVLPQEVLNTSDVGANKILLQAI